MNYIKDNKERKYYITHFNYQKDEFDDNFRLSGIRKNSQLPAKWLESTYK